MTSSAQHSPVSDFNADDETLKDVYFPDDPSGEILLEARIRSAFETAGYRIRQAGKAETHPVFIVHLIRTTAEHIPNHDRLFQHVRQLLSHNSVTAKKTDLLVTRTGDRISVSFLMQGYHSEV